MKTATLLVQSTWKMRSVETCRLNRLPDCGQVSHNDKPRPIHPSTHPSHPPARHAYALDVEVRRLQVLPDALRLRRDRPHLLPLLLHALPRRVRHLPRRVCIHT